MPSENTLLAKFEEECNLGDIEIDETHKEFITLVERIRHSSADKFVYLFQRLLEHTLAHFDAEELRMTQLSHGLLAEHRAEHQRILGDMKRFAKSVEQGRVAMAKAWATDSLLEWFENHAKTMDSALVADIVNRREQSAVLD